MGERVHKDVAGVSMQIRQFQKEAFARSRGYGPIDVEPVDGVLDQPHRLDAAGGEPPSAHGQ